MISDSEETYPYVENSTRSSSMFGIYDKKGVIRKVSLPVALPNTRDDMQHSHVDPM